MSPRLTGRKALARTNLVTSVVLILPLFIFYEIGVLFTDVMNGADLFTATLLELTGPRQFVLIQLSLLIVLLIGILYLKHRQKFEFRQCLPVLVESGIYALTMGTVIIFLMVDLLGIDPRLVWPAAAAGAPQPVANSVFDRVVLSAGAGVHEEFLFRFLIMGGLLLAGERWFGLRRWSALAVAIVVSSILFSLAHHLGPLGEPLRVGVFVYRLIAGAFFAIIYAFRNIAVAVYTHTFYDLYVMLVAG